MKTRLIHSVDVVVRWALPGVWERAYQEGYDTARMQAENDIKRLRVRLRADV